MQSLKVFMKVFGQPNLLHKSVLRLSHRFGFYVRDTATAVFRRKPKFFYSTAQKPRTSLVANAGRRRQTLKLETTCSRNVWTDYLRVLKSDYLQQQPIKSWRHILQVDSQFWPSRHLIALLVRGEQSAPIIWSAWVELNWSKCKYWHNSNSLSIAANQECSKQTWHSTQSLFTEQIQQRCRIHSGKSTTMLSIDALMRKPPHW